jgi:hypothetical protein
MTFEQWWDRNGDGVIRTLSKQPSDSFAAMEETLKAAIYTGWYSAIAESQGVEPKLCPVCKQVSRLIAMPLPGVKVCNHCGVLYSIA